MRSRNILDTSYLISHWRCRAVSLARTTAQEAVEWAQELIGLLNSRAIVTPIYIEFVAGTRTSHELQLARSFLAQFDIVDDGRVLSEDFVLARRFAERIPQDSKPRQFGDCLIRAIAVRLKYEVKSLDKRFAR